MASLNNLNLFEMKNQNKYAQLVEAQSPEPQELTSENCEFDRNQFKESDRKSSLKLAKNHKEQQDREENLLLSEENMTHGNAELDTSITTTTKNSDFVREEPRWKSASEKGVCGSNLIISENNDSSNVVGASKTFDKMNGLLEINQDNDSSDGKNEQIEKNCDILNTTNSAQIKSSQAQKQNYPSTSSSESSRSSPTSLIEQNNFKQRNSMSSSAQNNHTDSTYESCSSAINEMYDERNNKSNFKSVIKNSSNTHDDVKLNNTNHREVNSSFELNWKNLTFSYGGERVGLISKCFGKKKNLVLKDISGKIESNQLVAIIGPSGCGKTTLLHFLAGNNSLCKEKFNIIGLDEPKVAFIGQDDGLLPGLTAKETLIYASRLQNTKKNFNHEEHIKPIMVALKLSDCANRSVTKLSGGQAKRVTIAQELLYPTNLLILDEVTSGLDASTSYSIVKLLKQLVSDREHPMSIIMSIHQPSARLFSVFDKVYVMSEGYCLYEGSCKINLINDYLRKFNLECPTYHNIADYLIEIASECEPNCNVENNNNSHSITMIDRDNNNFDRNVVEQMINYQRKNSLLKIENNTTYSKRKTTTTTTTVLAKYDNKNGDLSTTILNDKNQADKENCKLIDNAGHCLYEAIERSRLRRERPILDHLIVHLSRSTLRIRRSYILTYLQFVTYIALGLQLSTFYGSDIGTLSGCPQLPMSLLSFVLAHDTGDDNINLEMRRIQENMNFLLVAIMTATFAALEITVITFPLEAKTVKREWRNGWYKVTSYFMGRTLADLPFQVTYVVMFSILIYSLTGQLGLTTWRFGSFVLIIIMLALIAQAVGFIFGAVFMNNLPAAVFTAPLTIFPTLLFSGFFSRVSQIPAFYKPLTYVSHFRYGFDALLVTLYGYNRCDCDQETLNSYHASFKNQTSTIKDMFSALFGSNIECNKENIENNEIENSIEDIQPTSNADFIKRIISNHTASISSTATTPMSLLSTSSHHIKTIEDSLVDTIFEHMNSTTTTTATTGMPNDTGNYVNPSDILVHKFSSKITTILNTRSNYGRPIPTECNNFNSYLMAEFDLNNNDLMFGLAMLFVFVILSRLLCNAILSFTIASRSST